MCQKLHFSLVACESHGWLVASAADYSAVSAQCDPAGGKEAMGNYKSRPGNSCSEEHLKKITELQSLLSLKVEADLQLREPSHLTELQEVRSTHTNYARTHLYTRYTDSNKCNVSTISLQS